MANTNTKHFDARLRQKVDTIENYLAKDEIYLEGEILFVKTNETNVDLYIGDGTHRFSELSPVFSTSWVMGKNTVNLTPIQILTTDWVNGVATKPVVGVLANESEQLIIPAWAAQSKEIALSCGIDFIIRQDGALDFVCNVTPTENIIVYIGIFGKLSEDENDNTPWLRTDIDTNLSSSSTNPLENRVITNKFNEIDATLRSITGEDGGSSDPTVDTSLTSISNKMKYVENGTNVIGSFVDKDGNKYTRKMMIKPFSKSISKAVLNPNSDIASVTVFSEAGGFNVPYSKMLNCYWSGEGDEFVMGSAPGMINKTTGEFIIFNVPVTDSAYTLNGEFYFEYAEQESAPIL